MSKGEKCGSGNVNVYVRCDEVGEVLPDKAYGINHFSLKCMNMSGYFIQKQWCKTCKTLLS